MTVDLTKHGIEVPEAVRVWNESGRRANAAEDMEDAADAAIEALIAEVVRLSWCLDEACKDPFTPSDPEWTVYRDELFARYEQEAEG